MTEDAQKHPEMVVTLTPSMLAAGIHRSIDAFESLTGQY